jgi:hypothetical protein
MGQEGKLSTSGLRAKIKALLAGHPNWYQRLLELEQPVKRYCSLIAGLRITPDLLVGYSPNGKFKDYRSHQKSSGVVHLVSIVPQLGESPDENADFAQMTKARLSVSREFPEAPVAFHTAVRSRHPGLSDADLFSVVTPKGTELIWKASRHSH